MLRSRLAAFLALLALAALVPAGALATGDPLSDRQWHLEHIGAIEAWGGGQGEAVVVAVVDSGVQADHPDLQGQVLEGRDFVDPGTAPDDPSGHGTVVAGIVAAIAGNDVGGAGIAPGAQILPVRVLDEDGRGRSSAVAAGIAWAVEEGAHVVNLSLTEEPGSPTRVLITSAVERAIRDAHDEGVVVVGAAGNEGTRSVPYGSDVPVLVVGATDREDAVWERSNHDRRTLFAPGVDIVSTFNNGGYAKADGTSFAAPIVAGAAALLLEHGVAHDEVGARLARAAVDVGAGRGRIDLARATAAMRPRATAEPSPPPAAEAAPDPPQPEPQPTPEPEPAPEPEPEPVPEPTPEPTPEPEPLVTITPEPLPDRQPAPAMPPGVTPLALEDREPEVAERDRNDLVVEPPPQRPPAEPAEPRRPGWPEGLALTLLVVTSVGHVVARRTRSGRPPAR